MVFEKIKDDGAVSGDSSYRYWLKSRAIKPLETKLHKFNYFSVNTCSRVSYVIAKIYSLLCYLSH